ncbi:hypothetical protein BDC45DRAFT_495926 [Circinella umbellata]|nr:hypothetical protein BDC45DRAFT_495926 [Circinella umbellata]
MFISNNSMFNEQAIPLETLSNADSTSRDGSRKSDSNSSSNTRRRNSGDDGGSSDDERSKGTLFSSYLSSNKMNSNISSNNNSTVSSNTTIKEEDDLRLQLLSVDKQVEQYNQLASSIIPEIDMLQVQEIISIGSIITNDNDTTKIRNIHCHAFIYQDTMLMTLPDIMSQKMDQSKFYSCVSELIEIVETIQCESLVIAINKNSKKSNIVLRALLYIGFQLVDPFIYKQDPIYILVGYEL